MSDKTQLGWKVPVAVVDRFKTYCDEVGSNYSDSIAAAMVIWQYLPASVQRQAHLEVSGKPSVDKKFWEEFRKGLDDAILGQVYSPPHRKK